VRRPIRQSSRCVQLTVSGLPDLFLSEPGDDVALAPEEDIVTGRLRDTRFPRDIGERHFARTGVVPLFDRDCQHLPLSRRQQSVGYLLIAVVWAFLVVDFWTALASRSSVTGSVTDRTDSCETTVTEIDPDATVDARGAACPGPLMDLIGKMRSSESGDVIRLLSDNDQSLTDVPEWAEEVGNDLLAVEECDDHNAFYVEKA